MKLNIDCVRDILLELETFPIGVYPVGSLKNSIANHGRENVEYTLVKLSEANYVNVQYCRMTNGSFLFDSILDITFQGHEFLEKIRSDAVWNGKVKPALSSIGSMSFDVISNVTGSVVSALVLGKLGL